MKSASKPKGHWPRGRRRHDPSSNWDVIRSRLWLLLDKRGTGSDRTLPASRRVSRHALAKRMRVSDRTVRRWLAGEDFPTARHAAAVDRWCERIEAI